MSDGANIYAMVSGIGDAFSRSYQAARKQQQEDEAPAIISNLMSAYGNGAAGQPGIVPASADAVPVAKTPAFAGGATAMRMPGAGGEIETRFVDALRSGGLTNPYGLAAMAAYANRESGYKPSAIAGSWSDPSESGQPGTSGGILSWRGPRFENMRRQTAGAKDPVTAQASYALTENPDLTLSLQRAGSVEEANRLMADAWRFAGYDRPGGEFDARLGATRQYLSRLGGAPVPGSAPPAAAPAPAKVASAEPEAADLPMRGAVETGFRIPGQDAPAPAPQGFAGFGAPATRMSPQLSAALAAAWKNSETRPMATAIYGNIFKGQDSAWSLSAMGDQPVLFNAKTAQVIPIGQAKRQTATVGNAVIDTATGQPIYQGPDKDADKLTPVPAGTTLYDPRTRMPVFTAAKEEKDEGGKIRDQIEARRKEAPGLGLIEGTPAWQSYVGTGKIGRDQDLSATDKKAIQEADEGVLSARSAINSLKQALDLSKDAYEGPTAGIRGAVTSIWGDKSGIATADLNNVVMTNALGQLKAIFGSNPTEGERAVMLQIQGSANQPAAVRENIFRRGIALAERRLDFEEKRAADLRGGTYYKQGNSPSDGRQPPNLPVKVTPSMKPDDIAKRYPKGTRLILPDGSEGVVP